jgi:uncharacterized protein (TIGR03086 family)
MISHFRARPAGSTLGDMETMTLHRRAVEEFIKRVDAVGDEQWAAPTPDTEWDVRTLVNHVVGEQRWAVPLLAGSTIEEVGTSLDGDLLGVDPKRAAHDAAEAAVAAVDGRIPVGGAVSLSYGAESVEEYVRQLIADHLIHGWDLAVAVGADTRLDPDLVAEVAEWYAERESMYRSSGAVADRVEGAADDPQSQLLSAFGRDARWTAPASPAGTDQASAS